MSKWIRVKDKLPSSNGNYLVEFYTRNRPEYDCTELAWRKFIDGKWQPAYYNYNGDGYEIITWEIDTQHLAKKIFPYYKMMKFYNKTFCKTEESKEDIIKKIENALSSTQGITNMIDELNNIINKSDILTSFGVESIQMIIGNLQDLK